MLFFSDAFLSGFLPSGQTSSLPSWLQPHWPRFTFYLEQLSLKYSRRAENKLKDLIASCVPRYSSDLLLLNYGAQSLHMKFLRQALASRDLQWFLRATQHGDRHASFPLVFDWDQLSSELRKYVVFCFIRFFKAGSGHTLRLFPCSLLRCVDFVEWLPSAGMNSGWESIRHYLGELQAWSMVCGFGNIRELDEPGFKLWKDNFKANLRVTRGPRGGDIPLRPWMLRLLVAVFPSDSDFDLFMKALMSLMWFSALRPCHFSPESLSEDDMKHLLQWLFFERYKISALGSRRAALHCEIPTAKQNQAEKAAPWCTATACICESYDCSPEEFADLTAFCPVCALERWRCRVPHSSRFGQYVFLNPATAEPVLRNQLNKWIRSALDIALQHLPAEERDRVVAQLSMKSWRSGAGTEIVTGGNAGFIAAAFLAHSSPDVTQRYYHKGGDHERLQVLPALADSVFQAGNSGR